MTEQTLLKEVKRRFIYDRDTGALRRKINIGSNTVKEKVAGGKMTNGYITVGIQGYGYLVHRLIWLIENGELPKGEIDHINHINDDNRIQNLRVVTSSDNSKNTKKPKNNTSGFVGVSYGKKSKKWHAYITHKGKRIHIGYYTERYYAIRARRKANKKYKFHINHGK